jgi:hypothetical protein
MSNEIREGDLDRQDGDECCATGLCEPTSHAPAFPAPEPRVRSDVMAAFWRGLIYRDDTGSEDQS